MPSPEQNIEKVLRVSILMKSDKGNNKSEKNVNKNLPVALLKIFVL